MSVAVYLIIIERVPNTITEIIAQRLGEVACAPPDDFLKKATANAIISIICSESNNIPNNTISNINHNIYIRLNAPYAKTSLLFTSKLSVVDSLSAKLLDILSNKYILYHTFPIFTFFTNVCYRNHY